MKTLIIGGGSEIGEHVLKQLSSDGHQTVTLAETENEADRLKDNGAADVHVTTNKEFASAYEGCEAIIFIAGANPISGESKNILVDYDTFASSVEEAKKRGIDRFIYLSAVRSDESKESEITGEKQKPEDLLRHAELTYTIIRPTLTVSKPGHGTVKAATSLKSKEGEIPFEDVAAFLVEALESEAALNKTIEITSGKTPIEKALSHL